MKSKLFLATASWIVDRSFSQQEENAPPPKKKKKRKNKKKNCPWNVTSAVNFQSARLSSCKTSESAKHLVNMMSNHFSGTQFAVLQWVGSVFC